MHPTAAKVRERLAERGLEIEVRELPDSTRTAADAAIACGCEVGQIVKSLVFVVDETPTMVLCAGDHRVERVDGRPATADEARAATGFAIGGIPRSATTPSCRRSSTSRCAASTASGARPARHTRSSQPASRSSSPCSPSHRFNRSDRYAARGGMR